jgi:hypothetical protein
MGCFTCRGKCNTKSGESTQSCEGTLLCKECSKLIHQSGIKEWFIMGYRDDSGFNFIKSGVIVEHIRR